MIGVMPEPAANPTCRRASAAAQGCAEAAFGRHDLEFVAGTQGRVGVVGEERPRARALRRRRVRCRPARSRWSSSGGFRSPSRAVRNVRNWPGVKAKFSRNASGRSKADADGAQRFRDGFRGCAGCGTALWRRLPLTLVALELLERLSACAAATERLASGRTEFGEPFGIARTAVRAGDPFLAEQRAARTAACGGGTMPQAREFARASSVSQSVVQAGERTVLTRARRCRRAPMPVSMSSSIIRIAGQPV